MTVYCVRTWASLREPQESAAPGLVAGDAALDSSLSAGDNLLARVGLTEQLRTLRARDVPKKSCLAVKHLPTGAVALGVSDRQLRTSLKQLLGLSKSTVTCSLTHLCGNRAPKWLAQRIPPEQHLRPIPHSEVAALALTDAPLELNTLTTVPKHRHKQQHPQQHAHSNASSPAVALKRPPEPPTTAPPGAPMPVSVPAPQPMSATPGNDLLMQQQEVPYKRQRC